MFYRRLLITVLPLLVLAAGCSTVVTALLINELLNDEAPKRTWTGTVKDTTGDPVGGVLVQVRAEVAGDSDTLSFSDTTDFEGEYRIGFRWHKDVDYTIRVVHDDVVFAEEFYGPIELKDQETNFILQSALSTELSGVVTDSNGDPLEGVLVVGASAASLEDDPVAILDTEGANLFEVTNESGVYKLEGGVGKYGIVCAYHPDYGFAYMYGEDDDSNGSIPLNIKMGMSGLHTVQVKVFDNALDPIANQVLSADRRFRLRLYQPFNLGALVDTVVTDEGLFQGLVGDPSDSHPSTLTINVLSTGDEGIAETDGQAEGGNYYLKAMEVDTDDAAAALVIGDNPIALADDTVIGVRVN